MYMHHFSTHYMEHSLGMSGCINMLIMNCSISNSEFDSSCLQEGTVNEASSLFINIFIECAKLYIPNKTIVVREDDKLW